MLAGVAGISFAPLAYAVDFYVSTGAELEQALTDASTDPDLTYIHLMNDVLVATPTVFTPAIAPQGVEIDTTGDFTLTLSGDGTVWDSGRYTTIGVGGGLAGGLTLSSGAQLTINDFAGNTQPSGQLDHRSGVLTITGEGTSLRSSYFTVGRHDDSTVTISDGAQIVTTREAALGEGPGYTNSANVTVLVEGIGTVWTADSFVVGGATNTVDVTFSSGAVVNATTASIGRNGQADLLVTGSDTKFTTTGVLRIGERSPWYAAPGLGDGTLTISDGGLVSARSVVLGVTGTATQDPSITGALVVDSTGTLETGELAPGLGHGVATFDNGTLRATANNKSLIHGFQAGDFVLRNEGMYLDSNGLDVVAESGMSGDGALTKQGAGKLTVTGANVYSGITHVTVGTLAAGVTDTFSANSAHIVDAGTLLDLQGYDQTVFSLSNSGVVNLGGTPGTVLTVRNEYAGNGGTILFNTSLGDDASLTDLLRVQGDTSGSSLVRVTNIGGTGAQTHNGIKIIDVAGISEGQFALLGDYVIEGQQAVIAGAYGYTLWHNGVDDPQDGHWYLRSKLLSPVVQPEDPLYQPGVPVYEAYPQVLLGMNSLPTLQQRVGNHYWNEAQEPVETVFCKDASQNFQCAITPDQNRFYVDSLSGVTIDDNGVWGVVEATHGMFKPQATTSGTDYGLTAWGVRAGVDGLIFNNEHGKLVAGLNARYGLGSADISSFYGDGSIGTQAYGVGATATWYGTNGFYLDAQGQATWFSSDLNSNLVGNLVSGNGGFGYALSLEGGQRIDIDESWTITPQAQLIYSNTRFNSFTDPAGANVSLDYADSLRARIGLAVEHQSSWKNEQGEVQRASVYGIGNLHYEFLDGTRVNVSGTTFSSQNAPLWGEIGLGGTYKWADDKYSLYGEVNASTSLEGFGDSYVLGGKVGLRVQW